MAASPLERLLGRLAGLTTVGVWVDVLLVSMVAGLAASPSMRPAPSSR